MTRAEWLVLAVRRLRSVLRRRIVATDRMLEQKICDAGPNNQRVQPLILTQARNALATTGRIVAIKRGQTPWYHLAEAPLDLVQERLGLLEPIYLRTQEGMFKQRVGQALEIAVMRALKASGRDFLGGYLDLDKHDDGTLYDKAEPPRVISGNRIEKGPLDYVVFGTGAMGGVEVKNYRTWLYPDSTEVKTLLWKCSDIGAVPVLVARRVPFITFRLLNLSGCLVYQHYNQLYANADSELAELARDKDLLGYHDVRIGNEPDGRMSRFLGELLPELVGGARATFERFRDIHAAYGREALRYDDWVREIMVGAGLWEPRERGEEGYSGWVEPF